MARRRLQFYAKFGTGLHGAGPGVILQCLINSQTARFSCCSPETRAAACDRRLAALALHLAESVVYRGVL